MKKSENIFPTVIRLQAFTAFILWCLTIQAQPLSEKLGAVKTDFSFYSGEVDLEVSQQFIIKNAGAYHYTGTTFDAGYGYGAGYEGFRLEFMTLKKLTIESVRKKNAFYRIGFYDASDNLLATFSFPEKRFSVARNNQIKNSPLFYSIDLLEVPLSMLDLTRKIDIIEVQ